GLAMAPGTFLSVIARSVSDVAIPPSLCHSEGAERLKNLTQTEFHNQAVRFFAALRMTGEEYSE
ncbi:MAG: hypothetical protein MUO97_04410, partial [Dehalococcoidia bacterium]|nr:hypothetical protein [Dehalococcoidia bacterium]